MESREPSTVSDVIGVTRSRRAPPPLPPRQSQLRISSSLHDTAASQRPATYGVMMQ